MSFPIIHTGIIHYRYVDIGTEDQSGTAVEAKEANANFQLMAYQAVKKAI